jgi:hypothetical protein
MDPDAGNKGEAFADKLFCRRGGITAFDVHGPAEPAATTGGRRLWWVTTTLSLGAGLIAAWADIAGGASWARIVTIWMVSAGAVYIVIGWALKVYGAARRLFRQP